MNIPYLTTPEAKAVARRLEKKGLLDPNFWVHLVPVWCAETQTFAYVLRYFETEDAEEPFALIHFFSTPKLSKSIKFVEQIMAELKWGWNEFKPNFLLVRKLPTLANTRRFKLQLLLAG